VKKLIFFACIIIAPLLISSGHLKNEAKTGVLPDPPIDTSSRLPVLHLRGTPNELGFQHGSIMKSKIAELVGLWKTNIETNYHIPAGEFIQRFLKSTNYSSSIQKWTPGLLEEIRGISAGSGIDFNTMLVFQLTDEIWANSGLVDPPHHCTSLGVNNYRKNGHSNFVAQNIDITPFYHNFGIILDMTDEKTGSKRLVVTFAGYLGANGLNKYIGVACNSLPDLTSSTDGLPVCCVVRGILERRSFEEAEQFLREIKHASGQNYIIGSRSKITSFECAAGMITLYWPDTSEQVTYHANKPLTNKSYSPEYLNFIKQQFNATPESVKFGDPRLDLMQKRMLNNHAVDLESIKLVLSESPIRNDNSWVSTIMEFSGDYSELNIKPVTPDSVPYITIRIKN
jgi:isopenicillin-N N-acyltransferase like protein